MSRPCVFLVADNTMGEVLKAFLAREQFHVSLGCGRFEFDPLQDLVVDRGGNDPGVFKRAHDLLQLYERTHTRALVMLDTAWEGSPGARAIADGIAGNLKGRWCEYAVVVIDPELEAWIWQDNPHVSRGLGHTNAQQSLRALLAASGEWPNGHDKPPRPKEVVERVLRSNRIPRSAAIYRQIAGRVSVNACTDQAFQALIQTLRGWFPTDVA